MLTVSHRNTSNSSTHQHVGKVLVALTVGLSVSCCASTARADIDPNSGIDFVRIGARGNAAWTGNGRLGDYAIGRGSVGYEYSIGKYEITTSQWVEFMNAALDRPSGQAVPFLIPPDPGHWGGQQISPTNAGGRRWKVATGQELHPVGDIGWRMSAIYCNWLHNGKSLASSAFMNGAYDVSTFGFRPGTSIFSDQFTHNAGAKYWIPTLDEWIKAAHYDPNKNGGQGGYWQYSISSDTAPVYGPPSVAGSQANSGFFSPDPFAIRLGAYANVKSPWGLLDVAGGTTEWTEEIGFFQDNPSAPFFRYLEGSAWFDTFGSEAADWIGSAGAGDYPSAASFNYGLRIASSVPTPSGFGMLFVVSVLAGQRRRGASHAKQSSRCNIYRESSDARQRGPDRRSGPQPRKAHDHGR